MAELPTGTVTFLFTDLEGSTRLWEERPDAMTRALVVHDMLLRQAIEVNRGVVIDHAGDGMATVFGSANDAVAAGVEFVRQIVTSQDADVAVLRPRVALHAAGAQLRADGRYVNQPLNRCARLLAVAHGGQVVASDAVEVLVRDALGPEVTFTDLGEHRLRDLTHPVRVFQLRAVGLRTDFPPLRSLDAFPGNLPRQLTSFVGRREELAGIENALGEWRLVTLTGTGGVGKTRLGVQVAAEVLPRFRDGAWLCELAVASDGEMMGQVISAELGVSQRPGLSREASISEYLHTKELLLVVDNCDQLLGPVGALAERILRECAGVRILATSREALAVDGEHVWPLRSLPLPEVGAGTATNDAAVLFVERAEAARATFVFDASNADAVGEICRRLDGIPLAIELAAARVVSMSPLEIAGLLDERFRLLTGGRRSAEERHQTLQATVDWSYALLGERERAVFDRLGVFTGSFDAAAAQAIVMGEGVEAWDVLDALAELVAKSMVVAEETGEGTTRYQLLETLRQYARERIEEHGDANAWRRRHAEYFVGWAEEAGLSLVGRDELTWRQRESAELDNLRAAVTWALDRNDPDDVGCALRIIGALAYESQMNGAAGVGTWAEQALPHVEIASAQLRYAVTAAAAYHQLDLGNYEQAQQLAHQAISDGVPPGAPAPNVAHLALAISTWMLGDAQQGLAITLDASRLLDRDFPGSAHASNAHAIAAMIATQTGVPIARAQTEVALRQARDTANPTALANALCAYGWALIADEPDAALAALDESIALSRQGAGPATFGLALYLAAGLRLRAGDLPHAARDLREGVERSHQSGERSVFFTSVWCGVEILTGLDQFAEAAVFDGIASTGLPTEWRAGSGWAPQRDAIAHARAALGPEHYDAVFQVGAAMTYDQAVDHTRRVLDDLINETSDTHKP